MQVVLDMKTRSIILAVGIAGGLSLGVFRATADLEVSAGVSIHSTAEFYEPLAAHGVWVEVGSYGRCWRPAGVAAGWRPYCDGHWEWTDCGWYWVSDEPWAWACYHYGRWYYDPNLGWVWIPGTEWAPAWVYWRTGDDYIGWAPCGPPGFVFAPSFFVFVESRHFHDPVRPGAVLVNDPAVFNKTAETGTVRRENREFDGRTRSVMVNDGPRVETVEKATGHKFTAVSVREADRQTFALIPKQIRRGTAESAKPQTPPGVQPPAIHEPGQTLKHGEQPGTPPRIPPNQGPPIETDNRSPKEIHPPQQPQAVPSAPAKPSEKNPNQGGDKDKKDKDHGRDNP